MSTFYTFLNDKFNLASMKEDLINALLNNINIQVNTPSNPAGTTSTTPVQMGLSVFYDPQSTGRVLVIVIGQASNNTAGDGVQVQLSYGETTAPANGQAATGTAIGSKLVITSNAAGQTVPFVVGYILTGLSTRIGYWFDLQVAAVTGGTASVSNITMLFVEF